MRTSDSPYMADWFVISLRWLILLGMAVSLALGDQLFAFANILLLALAGWNITLILLAGMNVRLKQHREISLGIDLGIAGIYFVLTGGFASSTFWILLLPLLTAAIYFGVIGALIAAGAVAMVEIGFTLLQSRSVGSVSFLGSSVFLTILLGSLFGLLGMFFIRSYTRARQSQMEAAQKKQRAEIERLHATIDRLKAIYGLTSVLTANLNYQRVLDSILDLSLSLMNLDPEALPDDRMIAVLFLFASGGKLEVGSARRLAPPDMRVTLGGQNGIIAEVLESDKPILLQEVQDDPELTHFVSIRNCGEVYCYPLRSGLNVYGVLLFSHPEAKFFSKGRRELLDILGSQAVIAIQNARLYQDVVDEREHMIVFQEEARNKLARDLHDGPTQSVSAIAMRAAIAQKLVKEDIQAASSELVHIEEIARRTTSEIRHMLFTLRPLVLESQGLVAALESMAEKMDETYAQNVRIKVDEKVLESIEMGKQGVIFYIVEEAVNNARKHAQAAHIWVNLRLVKPNLALLLIQDNGVGFDVAAVNRSYDQRGSLGMVNLRERTEMVNGVLDVQSVPGKGTRVQVYIPLTEEAADRLHHAYSRK